MECNKWQKVCSQFLSHIKGLLIVMFLTPVAIFLLRCMHLFRFSCKSDRILVLIRVEVLTNEYNEYKSLQVL